jgi:hypothetical protein
MPLGTQGQENESKLHNPATELPKYPQGDRAVPRYPAANPFEKNPSGRKSTGNDKSTFHAGHEGPKE